MANAFVQLAQQIYRERKSEGVSYKDAIRLAKQQYKPSSAPAQNPVEKQSRAKLIREWRSLSKKIDRSVAQGKGVPDFDRASQILTELKGSSTRNQWARALKELLQKAKVPVAKPPPPPGMSAGQRRMIEQGEILKSQADLGLIEDAAQGDQALVDAEKVRRGQLATFGAQAVQRAEAVRKQVKAKVPPAAPPAAPEPPSIDWDGLVKALEAKSTSSDPELLDYVSTKLVDSVMQKSSSEAAAPELPTRDLALLANEARDTPPLPPLPPLVLERQASSSSVATLPLIDNQMKTSVALFNEIDDMENRPERRDESIAKLQEILDKDKKGIYGLRAHDRVRLKAGIQTLKDMNAPQQVTVTDRIRKLFSPTKTKKEEAGGFVRSMTNSLPTSTLDPEDEAYRMMCDAVFKKNRPTFIGPYKYEPGPSNRRIGVWEDEKKNEIVIAFRGTANAADVRTDMKVLSGRLNQSKRYNEDKAVVRRLLTQNPSSKFVFSGYSLGGSIAIALMRAYNSRPNLRAVVFNAGVGFGARADKSLPIRFYHVKGDPVSLLGTRLFKDTRVIDSGHKDPIQAHKLEAMKGGGFKKMEPNELADFLSFADSFDEQKLQVMRFAYLHNEYLKFMERKRTRARLRKDSKLSALIQEDAEEQRQKALARGVSDPIIIEADDSDFSVATELSDED